MVVVMGALPWPIPAVAQRSRSRIEEITAIATAPALAAP
jgi:hypothetical protein